MAEGFAKHLPGNFLSVFSAGTEAKRIDPYAIRVMKEIGIDISSQYSKTIDKLGEAEFDYVITLCDEMEKGCPYFPAKYRVIHQGFDDPSRLAVNETAEEQILKHYRKVRDQIREYVETLSRLLIGEIQEKKHSS